MLQLNKIESFRTNEHTVFNVKHSQKVPVTELVNFCGKNFKIKT